MTKRERNNGGVGGGGQEVGGAKGILVHHQVA